MREGRYRILLVASHPVQYAAPIFRRMAEHPKLDILVAYCNLQGAQRAVDPGFGVQVKWDVPLLEGYPWILLPNSSWRPRVERFWGLMNLSLWKKVRNGGYDAILVFCGYAYASFWIAAAAAKSCGTPFLIGTDTTTLRPRDGKRWKHWAKRLLVPAIYRLAAVVMVASEAGEKFVRSLGISPSRVVVTPFVVDSDSWAPEADELDRRSQRLRWVVPDDAFVALFCAKLQPWKRPQDALGAFIKAKMSNSYLIFAGEGPLRAELEEEARSLGVAERVRFLGFVNQSELPSIYRAADLLVLPSEYDPCPVVVCEAMLCGCPVALSDEIRGRFDLVRHGKTGFIFPSRDTTSLAHIIRQACENREALEEMKRAALERMETWSPSENIEATIKAVQKSVLNR